MSILFRQSGGPLGDLMFTSHYMYFQKIKGNKVLAAIPTNLNPEIRRLYDNLIFIDEVIELPFFLDDEKFLKYCKDNRYEPCRFLLDLKYLKNLKFYPLHLWFEYDTEPTIDCSKAVGFQVTSSENYNRPKIPYLGIYVNIVENSGLKPIFFGTKKDEDLFINTYPEIYYKYSENDSSWRFGKDTLLQTIANIKNLYGHIVFSSGTSPIAAFQGVPVLELWNTDQWNFYSPLVHFMLGSPIHHIMQAYDSYPSVNLITSIFPRLKLLCKTLYGL
jgi:hypothetical protein